MWIYEALRGVELLETTSSTVDVKGVQYDSRRVGAGDVFVAMRGEATDGNQYFQAAVQRGALAVVTDTREAWASARAAYPRVPFYLAAHGRRALAGLSANLFHHPERSLSVCAVTGTNGKTTTAFLLEQMLKRVQRTCVLIGTIETHIADEVRTSEHTTPEARDLYALFADGVAAKATEVVMEMSSHALAQERVWGVHVDVAIFTNLTQDHLDYHDSMEDYFAAKAKMFHGVGTAPPRVSVLNADDADGGSRLLESGLSSRLMSYGIDRGEYRAEKISLRAGGTDFEFVTPSGTIQLASPLTGRVNVYNLLAAACAALARGLTLEQIAAATPLLKQVPGRFQVVEGSKSAGFTVVVDYAHTEDALRNLLTLARELAKPSGARVLTVFGCGGDRDRTKRAKMGKAAAELSDVVVVTSDNPRSERPEEIIEEILIGLRGVPGAKFEVEMDRERAIRRGILGAKHGDLVVIAGKGHEKTQTIGNEILPFDDVAISDAILRELV